MPESKTHALARARREGFKKSAVTKANKGGYYIAPHGVEKSGAKKAYANCRSENGSKEKCAKIAHYVQKKLR